MNASDPITITVLLPCLNEARTLGSCIAEARIGLSRANLHGEILVADNGSTDGSALIAETAGARVTHVQVRGYGSAIRAGVEAARGELVVIADADGSYDLTGISPLVNLLRDGADMAIGNRLKGNIHPGAMPLLHRYFGTPVITTIGRALIGVPVGDFNSGIRAFRRVAFRRLRLQSTGMELASEMLVKAHLAGLKIAEVPATLRRDGRDRPPHLRPWRDALRHLYQIAKFSPRANAQRIRLLVNAPLIRQNEGL
jgi:glycosyltransferase involved in cell wall biosynthesis